MNTIIELMPAAAAATSRARPVVVPDSVTKPARRPPVNVLARISDMLGPGVSASRMQAAMKVISTSGDMRAPWLCHAEAAGRSTSSE